MPSRPALGVLALTIAGRSRANAAASPPRAAASRSGAGSRRSGTATVRTPSPARTASRSAPGAATTVTSKPRARIHASCPRSSTRALTGWVTT
jgi:hypothetical protein